MKRIDKELQLRPTGSVRKLNSASVSLLHAKTKKKVKMLPLVHCYPGPSDWIRTFQMEAVGAGNNPKYVPKQQLKNSHALL